MGVGISYIMSATAYYFHPEIYAMETSDHGPEQLLCANLLSCFLTHVTYGLPENLFEVFAPAPMDPFDNKQIFALGFRFLSWFVYTIFLAQVCAILGGLGFRL